ADSVVDGNADATNVTATDLVISSSAGVGSQDALETAVSNLEVTNTDSGDVQISNTGILDIQSVVNQAGDINLTTSLDLTVSGEVNSSDGAVTLVSSGGSIIASGSGPHLKAADDSFIKAQTTAGSFSAAFDVLVPTADVTVTLTGDLDADRGFFTGSTLSDTLAVESTSSGVIYFNGSQVWPQPEPTPTPDPTPAPTPDPTPAPTPDSSTILTPTLNSEVVPYLASVMAKKIERGYLELSDSLVIVSSNQATPHFYSSHLPLSIDTTAIGDILNVPGKEFVNTGSASVEVAEGSL
ncbi:MAG: hypothetical protein JSV34_03845, partial [Candidatus Omnitrophota bacterium]